MMSCETSVSNINLSAAWRRLNRRQPRVIPGARQSTAWINACNRLRERSSLPIASTYSPGGLVVTVERTHASSSAVLEVLNADPPCKGTSSRRLSYLSTVGDPSKHTSVRSKGDCFPASILETVVRQLWSVVTERPPCTTVAVVRLISVKPDDLPFRAKQHLGFAGAAPPPPARQAPQLGPLILTDDADRLPLHQPHCPSPLAAEQQ